VPEGLKADLRSPSNAGILSTFDGTPRKAPASRLAAAPDRRINHNSPSGSFGGDLEDEEAAPVDFDRLSRDQISKRIAARFHGHGLAQLVGEISKVEGFVTLVSLADPDGGVDSVAGQRSMSFDGSKFGCAG
jgi:predicted Mrr-cat superfamily restriction endonuclease